MFVRRRIRGAETKWRRYRWRRRWYLVVRWRSDHVQWGTSYRPTTQETFTDTAHSHSATKCLKWEKIMKAG